MSLHRAILDAMKSFAVDAPRELKGKLIDIEELDGKLCKKSGKACVDHCKTKDEQKCENQIQRPIHIIGDVAQLFKPTNLQDLIQLLAQQKTENYRLVFGNTSFGLYQKFGPWNFSVLIDIRGVKELYTIQWTVFADSNGTQAQYSLVDFLSLDLKGKVITSVTLPKFTFTGVRAQTYKPSHCLQTHAVQTEAFLLNKQLGDPTILKNALSLLSSELVPESRPSWSSATYRKSLALSIIYKFVLNVCQSKVSQRYTSGATGLVRTPIVGTQDYGTDPSEYPVSKPMPKITAPYLASGKVGFLDDLPPVPGQLFASPVLSTVGNADIDSMDPSIALTLPEVKAFIKASDIPKGGTNDWRPQGIPFVRGHQEHRAYSICWTTPWHYCGSNILQNRMAPVKASMVNPTWEQLVQQCYEKGIDLTASFMTYPTDKYASRYNYYSVACVEAELDVLNGQYQLRLMDMLYDAGISMNPELDIGQAEGGFIMGMGYFLLEGMKFDPTIGKALHDGTWDYKIPLAKDLPMNYNFKFIRNAPNPLGVLRSKAVGEPPLTMGAAALLAIKHAVEAA
uniref:Aldehyde oxidase/xanthine dehydrogenase a/b hammerhead domain-containing protein n=1 Tax=Biomphalaria glabrata TaxID=6526 RepID=A0A2C9KXF5_BIOGL